MLTSTKLQTCKNILCDIFKIVIFVFTLCNHFEADHIDHKKQMITLTKVSKARSHGLVVNGDDLQSRDCGFESQRHILDGCKRCYSYYVIKKITKIKVAKWGTPKKIFKN